MLVQAAGDWRTLPAIWTGLLCWMFAHRPGEKESFPGRGTTKYPHGQ